MPLTRIFIRKGSRTASQKAVIMSEVYEALRETYDVPADDRFMIVTEHGPEDFVFGRHYLGIARSDDLVIIQLTVSDTRSFAKKQALYKRIAGGLCRELGMRPEDVFINLVETRVENWSFGHGEAQYATGMPAL